MGMLGDVYDFCEILEWTGEFWSRQEPLYWMWSFRLAVGEAIEELCLAFEYAEMCHRRYYMFGIDWDHKSEEHDVCFFAFLDLHALFTPWLTIKL